MTYDTKAVVVGAVAPDTETDLVVEEVAVEDVAPEEAAAEAPVAPAAKKEMRFPKVVKRDEETGITHYSPKAHTELDPASRFKD